MKPFLRPVDRGQLAPVGWVSQPAGRWEGQEVDVVYDPRLHDVLLVRYDPGDGARDRFHEVGYRRVAIDEEREMWVRDRSAVVGQALDRVGRARGAGIGGRSL